MAITFAIALLLNIAAYARAEPLSISSCVLTALQASPEIRQAQWLREAAGSDVRLARSILQPQLQLVGAKTLWGYNENDRLTKPRARGPENYSADLNATWRLLNGGGEWLTISERKRLYSAAGEFLESARRAVEFEAVARYYSLIEAEALVKVADEHSRLTREQAELTRRLYGKGQRGRGDILKSGISAKQGRVVFETALAGRATALAKLNAILGARPDRSLEVAVPEQPVKAPRPLEDHLALARAQRPDLRQARRELEAAEDARSRAKLDMLPAVSLSGTLHRKFDAPIAEPDPSWHVAVGVSVPLWDGLSRLEAARRAHYEEAVRQERLAALERDAAEEIFAAWTAVEAQSRVYRLSRDQIETAREALQFVVGNYRQGAASILELTDAQTQLSELEQQYLQAYTAYHVAQATLNRATGVPWSK